MKKNAQFATKIDNNFKMYHFFTFSCNFRRISKSFMNWNGNYLHPRMISLSNRVVCGDKFSFVKKKELPQGPQSSQKIIHFLHFCILQRNFRKSFNQSID